MSTPYTLGAHNQETLTLQRVLSTNGYYTGALDGIYGPQTQTAVEKARTALGFSEARSINDIIDRLNALKGLDMTSLNIGGVVATAGDYLVNFLTSKINWAAALLVGVAVTWINTRFGFNVPPDIQNWVTGLLVTGFSALIMVLRTFFNSPHVATAQPAIVTGK